MTSTAAKARASGSRFARVRHWFGRFESPTTTYYLLLATTAIPAPHSAIWISVARMRDRACIGHAA